MNSSPAATSGGRRGLVLAVQGGASLLVLGLLLREAELDAVAAALRQVALPWLLLTLLVKVAALSLHELRIWCALLPSGRPHLGRVMGIGFLGGMLNFVFPARLGDVIAMALLAREEKVPTAAAVAAVGLVSFLEAAGLGVFLLLVFSSQALHWEDALGAIRAQRAVSLVATATLGSIALIALIVLASRFLERGAPREERGGLLGMLRQAVLHTGTAMGRWRHLLLNLSLTALDVALFAGTYWLLLPTLGIQVSSPVLASAAVMALASLAAVVLPPGLGAGTAAAAVFVLGLYGVSEPQAVAYAAMVWLVGNGPSVLLGLPPLWKRLGAVRDLLARGRQALEETPDPPTA